MKKNKDHAKQCINSLAEAASSILMATEETADANIKKARKHLATALDSGKEVYTDLHRKATDALRR